MVEEQLSACRRYVLPVTLGSIYREYQVQPPHPEDWLPVLSRALEDDETHGLNAWLWTCCEGRWSPVTWYVPALKQLVFFERVQDAVKFKLAWGGTQ